MFCSQCGNNNADGAAFCANCGAPLNAQQPQQAPQSEYQAPQPEYQAPQYQQAPYIPTPKPEVPGKGMGIAAMILGIVSLVFMCWFFYLAIPCAIVGLILGCIAISKAKKAGMNNGMAIAGITCSAIGLGFSLFIIIFAAIGVAFVEDMFDYYYYYFIRSLF